jgi:hypothetical protein
MAIQFDNPAHEETFQVVEDFLVALELEYLRWKEQPIVTVPFSNGVDVHIVVRAWGDDDAILLLRTWLVRPERLDEELLRFMLERNYSQRMGTLALDADGDVLLRHALGGSHLDQKEFRDAVYAVEVSAARLRAEILDRFGGASI